MTAVKYGAPIVAVTMAAVMYAASGPSTGLSAGHDVPSELNSLYEQNCAGCHGANGTGGAARGLTDEIFLRIAPDAVIRDVVARGVPRTAMPAFARAAGGDLTDDQIDTIVSGLRARGANAGVTPDLNPPPYAMSSAGDPSRGGASFATFGARCHGTDGRGGPGAGSIVDPAYLALVSDQSLRTTVIAGRADLSAPDWRGNVPGTPMSAQEVSDVVAWLAARRMP